MAQVSVRTRHACLVMSSPKGARRQRMVTLSAFVASALNIAVDIVVVVATIIDSSIASVVVVISDLSHHVRGLPRVECFSLKKTLTMIERRDRLDKQSLRKRNGATKKVPPQFFSSELWDLSKLVKNVRLGLVEAHRRRPKAEPG